MAFIQTSLKVAGVDEMYKRLLSLPDKVIRKGLRQSVSAGATPILRAARDRAPIESGGLKMAMAKKAKAYPSGVAVALIGVNKQIVGTYRGRKRVPNKYLHLVELGTHPHAQPKRGTQHPGAKANPFLLDAFNSEKANSVKIMGAKLGTVVEKEFAKG